MGIIRKDFRFKIVKNILSKEEIELLKHYFRFRHRNNKSSFGIAAQNKTNSHWYADPVTESLLLTKQKIIEKNCGLELLPSYSFWRMYTWGSDLKNHKDRDCCEISITIAVDSDLTEPWPIYIEGKEVNLNIGDGVIYLGCEDAHERKELLRDYYSQCFLHYVNKNGPNAKYALDERTRLGLGKSGISQ